MIHDELRKVKASKAKFFDSNILQGFEQRMARGEYIQKVTIFFFLKFYVTNN